MSVYHCPYCGSLVNEKDIINNKDGIIECDYCGVVFTLPKFHQTNEIIQLLNVGSAHLDIGKFDDAFETYKKVTQKDPTEPEGYFGMALATFNISMLRDKVNQEMSPVCHKIVTHLFSNDPNYKKALSLATARQKEEYENKAEFIDKIISKFAQFKKERKQFDCFISAKSIDEQRNLTNDGEAALNIYTMLKDEGVNVFFSEESLKGLTSSESEALKLFALVDCKCFLLVCGDKKNLRAVRLENDYSRYVDLINVGKKKKDSITAVYLDSSSPISKIPSLNGSIQGIDYNEFDASEMVINFVQRFISDKKEIVVDQQVDELLSEIKKQEEKEKEKKAKADALKEEKRIKELESKFQKYANVRNGTLVSFADNYEDKEIAIPNSIHTIGESVFEFYNGIKKIYLPSSLKNIDRKAFYFCRDLEEIIIPSGVRIISENAFAGCKKLKRAILSEGVQEIQKFGFSECSSLQEVVLPSTLRVLKERAFNCCESLKEIVIPGVPEIGFRAFLLCKSLRKVEIKEGTKLICKEAFYHCEGLNTIDLPRSLEKIEENAFAMNEKITSLNIPSVKIIEDLAFFKCKSLNNVIIPANTTSLGWGAFAGCGSIEVNPNNRIFHSANNCVWQNDGTLICANGNFKIPTNVGINFVGHFAFACSNLTEIEVPEGIYQIGDEAFNYCSNLRKIVLPSTIQYFGRIDFETIKELNNVTLSNYDETIKAFSACKTLKEVSIHNLGVFKIMGIKKYFPFGCKIKSI